MRNELIKAIFYLSSMKPLRPYFLEFCPNTIARPNVCAQKMREKEANLKFLKGNFKVYFFFFCPKCKFFQTKFTTERKASDVIINNYKLGGKEKSRAIKEPVFQVT